MLLAAVRLLGRSGGAGTTLAAIAAGAGVAAETIYTGFSSKKALLRAAMAVAIVGDAQPVPLIEPPVLSIAASVTPSSASQAAIFRSVRHALAAAIRST